MSLVLLGDLLRVAALIVGGGVIAVASVVVVVYIKVYLRARALAKQGRAEHWRGLLPRHVAVIGGSYIGLVVGTLAEMTVRFHDPLTWRPPTYATLYLLGLWALWDILGHQQHRKHGLAPHHPEAPEVPTD